MCNTTTRSVYIYFCNTFVHLQCLHFIIFCVFLFSLNEKRKSFAVEGSVKQSQWSTPCCYISFLSELSQPRVRGPVQTSEVSLTSRHWTTREGGMSTPAPPQTTARAMTTPVWGLCTLTMAMVSLGSSMKPFSKFICNILDPFFFKFQAGWCCCKH